MAIQIDESTTIQRPTEEVFAYVAKLENMPEWQDSVLQVTPEGDVGVGTKAKVRIHFAGRTWDSDLEVSEYEAGRQIGYRARSPVPGHFVIVVEPDGQATRVREVGTIEPSGFFKLAEPLLARLARRTTVAELETLKDILEARG